MLVIRAFSYFSHPVNIAEDPIALQRRELLQHGAVSSGNECPLFQARSGGTGPRADTRLRRFRWKFQLERPWNANDRCDWRSSLTRTACDLSRRRERWEALTRTACDLSRERER